MSELPELEVYARYIFLDVVNFTSKTAEARTGVLNLLNKAVVETVEHKEQVPKGHVIYLPTGDGICIALLDIQSIAKSQSDAKAQSGAAPIKPPYDIHLRVALNIIKFITEHNGGAASGDHEARLKVRIGINEDRDYEVLDINGSRNIAGVGINDAQRIMSLAGGNQIFVGENAYRALHDHDSYRDAHIFHLHQVIVKHDTPMNVYQFVAKGHAGLNTDVQELERRQESVNLIKAATDCGLKKIYPSRGSEVERDILNHIDQARTRVWMLGVGLTEKLQFSKLLPEIGLRLDEVNVKILLLNALRSPALFRTFLEIEPTSFHNILANNNREYFQRKLYHDFHSTFSTLKYHPEFNSAVRFYGHTPICWMVIVDDTAYFQPYSFGGEAQGESRVIGPWLPVFKFQPPQQDEGTTNTFEILEQHFDRLWRTSNADLFHMGLRVENRDNILDAILKDRGDWYKYVYNALYGKAVHYANRKYPRRACGSKAEHTILWQEDGKPKEAKPDIVNFSRDGVRLSLKDSAPAQGTSVTLKIEKIPNDDVNERSVEYIKKELLMPCNGKFKVIWQKRIGSMINIGLSAEPPDHPPSSSPPPVAFNS